METVQKKAQRRRDPQRRDRIAAAALQVIAEHGIKGLTHRAVAEAANVPLGSTTYHFATLDDLIHAALEQAANDYAEIHRAWAKQHAGISREELATVLADGVLAYCFGPYRDHATVEYELYLAALRRPALRATAKRYNDITVAGLSQLTDPETASALSALINGLNIRYLLAEQPPSRDELLALIMRTLTPPGRSGDRR